jgi:hypothetical protein
MIETLSPAALRTHRSLEWQPGLRVALAAFVTAGAPIVRVHVDGAQPPFRLRLYVDGELADVWSPAADVTEVACPALGDGGRHSVTARAVDATGRWGAASVLSGSEVAVRR